MKRITLTQGQFAIVDDDDFVVLSKFKWQALWCPKTRTFYAARCGPRDTGPRRRIIMHREVVKAIAGSQVDHANHNTLDNRKRNLRICIASQNQANQLMRADNTSGYKGVSWHKRDRKWQVRVSSNGKRKYIGTYESAREAAVAHDRAAVRLNGKFAMTNKKLGLIKP